MGAEILLCLPFWKNQERVDNQRVLIPARLNVVRAGFGSFLTCTELAEVSRKKNEKKTVVHFEPFSTIIT